MKSSPIEPRYLFIIADRKKAYLFTFQGGVMEDYKEVYDPSVPQKVKSNKGEYYARNDIILRHIQEHLRRHLQKISEMVDSFIKDKQIHAVFIGGHKPLFHDIKIALNHDLQRKLKGEFITELNIPRNQLIQNAEKALKMYSINEKG